MAYTTDQLDAKITALESALASGALRVDFADRSTTYRSVDELKQAIDYFRGLLNTGRSRQSVAVGSSGFCR